MVQLASLQLIAAASSQERQWRPNVTLASSGGNVCAYITSAADWDYNRMEYIATMVTPSMFMSEWLPVTPLSPIAGFFQGSVYNRGSGVSSLFHDLFTETSIKKHEVWTGTYDKTERKSRLFCNLSARETCLPMDHLNVGSAQCLDSYYMDGDISLIAKVSVASASIPTIVPPQNILGGMYQDGGVAMASPLTMMQDPISRRARSDERGRGSSLHIMYINSMDVSSPRNPDDAARFRNIIGNSQDTVSDMVRAQTVVDRSVALGLIARSRRHTMYLDFKWHISNIEKLVTFLRADHVAGSVTEVYPIQPIEIDIINFTPEDVTSAMTRARLGCRARFWWISAIDAVPDLSAE